ncbi:hypothetical protein BH23GEM1_BH23GEM1_07010 [soil metagenome]
MSKTLALALLCAIIATACAERTTEPLRSPGGANRLIAPEDGEATYYSSGVNTTYYGGYSGYDNPDAARTAVYTEELIWSSSTNFWDIRETFSSEYGPFGAEASGEPGVSQALRTRSDLVAYDRAGQLISQPDTTLALTSAPSANLLPAVPPRLASIPSSNSNGLPPGAPQAIPGRAALDRRVITPAAAARTLAQLRNTAEEIVGQGGNIRFQIQRGNTRVLLTFTPAFGAVTKTRVEEAGGTVAETDYSYTAIPGGFVLTEERTTIHLMNAAQPLIFVRKYSGLSIR